MTCPYRAQFVETHVKANIGNKAELKKEAIAEWQRMTWQERMEFKKEIDEFNAKTNEEVIDFVIEHIIASH